MATTFYLSNHPETHLQAPALEAQNSLGKSILLHLLPGAFVMLAFILLSPIFAGWVMPPMLVFMIAVTLVLIPIELGTLFWLGKRYNGRFSLDGIVLYRNPLPFKQALWIIPATFIAALGLFLLFSFADSWLYTHMFTWWPAALDFNPDPTTQPQQMLLITVIVLYLIGNLSAPIVEEIYFRGYLLPRLSRYGKWAPVINSILFALYHFWSPWNLVSRAFGMLPIAYMVQRKKNITISIIVHCALNCIGSIPMLLYVLRG